MRIEKTTQTTSTPSIVVNEHEDSGKNTYSTNYINRLMTYSSEEQRVGTWLDGKPLYRKVIKITDLSFDTVVNINTDISDIDQCFIENAFTVGSQNTARPIMTADRSATSTLIQIANNKVISYYIGSSLSGTSNYILAFVCYTKTTDTPSSGKSYELDTTAKVVNSESDSEVDTYSCNYINNKIKTSTNTLIEDLTPVVLYENASGTTTDITLTDSSANYKYLEIYYNRYYEHNRSTKVASPNNKSINLTLAFLSNDVFRIYTEILKIDGKNLTRSDTNYINFTANPNTIQNISSEKSIFITKVLGYKDKIYK